MVRMKKRTLGKRRVKSIVVKTVAKSARRRRTRRRNIPTMRMNVPLRFTPFERCVYGPVNMSGTGMGAPDGCNLPSIVIEHRFVVTVKPDSLGRISFAHVPSPLGSFAIRHGVCTTQVNVVSALSTETNYATPNLAYAFSSDTAVLKDYDPGSITSPPISTVVLYDGYHIIPFTEWLGVQRNVLDQMGGAGTFGVEQFRIIANVGSFAFTGSSLANAGVSAVAREEVKILLPQTDVPGISPVVGGTLSPWQSGLAIDVGPPPGLAPGGAIQAIGTQGSVGITGVSANSGVVIRPVTCGGDLINVPTDFDYQPMRMSVTELTAQVDQFIPGVARPFTQLAQYSGSALQVVETPQPGMGHAPSTFVAIEGMDPSASITYTARTCAEYQIKQTSSVHRFAKLGPPANLAAIERVRSLSRLLPASKEVSGSAGDGWLSSAASWYVGTMKSIMAKEWEVGSKVLGFLPQARAARLGLSAASAGMSQLSLGGGNSYNIQEIYDY